MHQIFYRLTRLYLQSPYNICLFVRSILPFDSLITFWIINLFLKSGNFDLSEPLPGVTSVVKNSLIDCLGSFTTWLEACGVELSMLLDRSLMRQKQAFIMRWKAESATDSRRPKNASNCPGFDYLSALELSVWAGRDSAKNDWSFVTNLGWAAVVVVTYATVTFNDYFSKDSALVITRHYSCIFNCFQTGFAAKVTLQLPILYDPNFLPWIVPHDCLLLSMHLSNFEVVPPRCLLRHLQILIQKAVTNFFWNRASRGWPSFLERSNRFAPQTNSFHACELLLLQFEHAESVDWIGIWSRGG